MDGIVPILGFTLQWQMPRLLHHLQSKPKHISPPSWAWASPILGS